MQHLNLRALVVDDEEHNREILQEDLEDEGYEVVCAEDGKIALDILQKDSNFSVILLDRMMPNMSGMEFTKVLKADKNSKLAKIPIIMQTAAAEKSQIAEGIAAGVFYYLTKPFESEVMLSIVKAATEDYADYSRLKQEVDKFKPKLNLIKESYFEIKTLDDVRYLSTFISNYYPDPERVIFGISELLVNAVEHGNLGIDYSTKSKLMIANTLEEKITELQNLPENINKKIEVHYRNDNDRITLKITDEGKGFDWQKYMEIDPNRATDPHGRGIALSKMMSFDELRYMGEGNQVECVIYK